MDIDLKKLYAKMRKFLNPEMNPSVKEKWRDLNIKKK